MPWKETTPMSERAAFIEQAKAEGANISALCRSYRISRKTAYKWLNRERLLGAAGLENQSRRPKQCPKKTGSKMEEQVLSVRQEHPVWGGRKIRKTLEKKGCQGIPAASTITAILRRNQQIDHEQSLKHKPMQRFERNQPNELWQMDFKGYFALAKGGYCHPLTVIDDHSRFLLGLKACPNETFETVQSQLTAIFQKFGLPERMLMDNGSPWGDDWVTRHTILTAWLLRLGIAVSHGRPYHPQTQGKDERFNRTLKAEVISRHTMADLVECQTVFDDWQSIYNNERPHDALQLDTPSLHYQKSPHSFPEILPPITYAGNDEIRKVDQSGKICFRNHVFRVGKAFRYQPVALHPQQDDGKFDVFFCKFKVAQIDLYCHNQC
jgi:transposase InsO family protein